MSESLRQLLDAIERSGFYGELAIKFEDGKAVRAEKKESIRL